MLLFTEEKKSEVVRITRPLTVSPREPIHRHITVKETQVNEVRLSPDVVLKTAPQKPHIPFLKTPENQEPAKPVRKFRDERVETSSQPLSQSESVTSSINVETLNLEMDARSLNAETRTFNVEPRSLDVETRNVETRNVETRNVETRNVETRIVETRNVETRNVETRNVETKNVETRKPTNPINKQIDGAPTRRPKVPKVLAVICFYLLFVFIA